MRPTQAQPKYGRSHCFGCVNPACTIPFRLLNVGELIGEVLIRDLRVMLVDGSTRPVDEPALKLVV